MNSSIKVTQMKNILGSLSLFLAMLSALHAQKLAEFNFELSNTNPYVKEAVQVTFKAKQKEHTEAMFFFLTPKSSPEYKIVLLNKVAQDVSYHNKQTEFTYLLFPKKSGKINVKFDFVIKTASDKAIAQVYEGSRDNVKSIDTTNTKIDIKPISLHVKDLAQKVDLVGDFKISSKLESSTIKPFESANITYYLQGTGYDEFHLKLIDTIDNVKIFSDVVKHYNKATKDGYKIQREFKYALVADKDFTIKSATIKCFNPKTSKYYDINTKPYTIKVEKIDETTLVDAEDFPKPKNNFAYIKNFLIYALLFLSGFLTAKFLPKNFSMFKKPVVYEDITNAVSAKELLNIIVQKYNTNNLTQEIKELEDIVYNKKKANFKKIKKKILKKLEG